MAEARWLDAIGNEAWDLENASHFLGRVIPLINTNDGATTLLTVGGLFLLYHADVDSLCDPFFAVLRPGLSLEAIVARLPRKFIDNEDFAMGGGVVANSTRPDTVLSSALKFIDCAGDWERRHGCDRWREFKMRGGKGDIRLFWSEEPIEYDESLGPVEIYQLLCIQDCPLCGS